MMISVIKSFLQVLLQSSLRPTCLSTASYVHAARAVEQRRCAAARREYNKNIARPRSVLLLVKKHDVSDDSEEQQGGQGERVLQEVLESK